MPVQWETVNGNAGSSTGRTRLRSRPLTVWMLLVFLFSLGLRGVIGGGQFLLDPSGDIVGLSTAELERTPFENYLIPGLILSSVLGIAPLVVTIGVYRGRRWAWFGSIIVAIALVVWVIVEGIVIGFGKRLQYPNLLQAVAMLVVAGAPSVRAAFDA